MLSADGYFIDAARTNGEAKQAHDDNRDFISMLSGASAKTELTIAAGVVTIPAKDGGNHSIDTEADAAADDLTHIDQTNTHIGQLIIISVQDAGRVVTIKNSQAGAGEILLSDSADLVLDNVNILLYLRRVGTTWVEEFRIYGNDFAAWAAYFNVGRLGAVNAWTKNQYYTLQVLTDGATVDWDLDAKPAAKLTAAGDRTINNPTNIREMVVYLFMHKQDATGTRNPSWGTKYDFSQITGGVAPDLSARAANKEDVFIFIGNVTDDQLDCVKHIQRA